MNEHVSKNVLVMGCGHLYSFLHPKLKDQGHTIYGVSRSFSTQPDHAIAFDVGKDSVATLPHLKKIFHAVVWNFPPLPHLLDLLIECDRLLPVTLPWIFVSSTSVYALPGPEQNNVVTENSPLSPESKLWPVENFLAGLKRPVCVLRPGGLVDERRHPGNFFRNRPEVSGGLTPINLVHTEDLAQMITYVLEHGLWPEVFNLVAPYHPSRQEFYSKAMAQLGLKPPNWSPRDSSQRLVSSAKAQNIGFTFHYCNLSNL